MAPCLHRPPCGKLVAVPGVRHAPTSVGVRPLPWKSARRAGSVAPGRLGNRWFLASRRHTPRVGRTELPRAAAFRFRAANVGEKGHRSGGIPLNSAAPARPFPNTRRTPNPAFRDWGHSARLGPSRQRRGSRRCGTPPASGHRRCNPLSEMNAGSVRAPLEHQLAIRAPLRQQVGQALPIALLVHDDAGVVAASRARAARNRPCVSAPPGRQEVPRSAVH